MASQTSTVTKDISFTGSNIRPGAIAIRTYFDVYRPVYTPATASFEEKARIPGSAYEVSVEVKLEKSNATWQTITTDSFNDPIPGDTISGAPTFVRYQPDSIQYDAFIPAANFPSDWIGKVRIILAGTTNDDWPNQSDNHKPVLGLGLKRTTSGNTVVKDSNNESPYITVYTATTVISPFGAYIGDIISNDIEVNWMPLFV